MKETSIIDFEAFGQSYFMFDHCQGQLLEIKRNFFSCSTRLELKTKRIEPENSLRHRFKCLGKINSYLAVKFSEQEIRIYDQNSAQKERMKKSRELNKELKELRKKGNNSNRQIQVLEAILKKLREENERSKESSIGGLQTTLTFKSEVKIQILIVPPIYFQI